MKWGLMGSNSATIWSSISTGFANLWSNQDLPRGKSTSDCQFHFLPPSLFENTYILCLHPYFNVQKENLFCSKKHILYQKNVQKENLHIYCVCIHTSIFKKRIHSRTITYVGFKFTFSLFKKRICSVPKNISFIMNSSLCSNYIYLFWSIFQCSKKRIHS